MNPADPPLTPAAPEPAPRVPPVAGWKLVAVLSAIVVALVLACGACMISYGFLLETRNQ